MSHPYSNAAGYIYANEYEAPSDTHGTLTVDHQPSVRSAASLSPFSPSQIIFSQAGRSHYAHCNERVEIDPRRFGNIDRMRPGQARAMGPGMKSISTTTTQTSSNTSPFNQVSSLPSRTTSNHSHGNPGPAVKYTPPSKRVHTPYDPFAYHPSVYDTQDFVHTDDPPKAQSKFRFKFKLTLPSVFRFRSYPRSPTSSWPPDSSLLNTLAAQLPSIKTTTTTTRNPCFPLHGRRGIPLYDDDDDDPSSSHWRWSSFEQHKSSSFKLRRWLSKTKSKTFTKSVAPPRPSTYHAPLQNAHQEWDKSHTKTSSGDLHRGTMKGRTNKGSLRFAQDVARK